MNISLIKKCKCCGTMFEVSPYNPRHTYCSKKCRDRDNFDSEKKRIYQSKYYKKLRKGIINHYGGKCDICGEDHIECLTIDHSFNDGAEHRREVGMGTAFYNWLKKNNYPDDLGLRVLCWNCNCSIGCYGYSPLEERL